MLNVRRLYDVGPHYLDDRDDNTVVVCYGAMDLRVACGLPDGWSCWVKKYDDGAGIVNIRREDSAPIDGANPIWSMQLPYTKQAVHLAAVSGEIIALNDWRRSPIISHRTVTRHAGGGAVRDSYNILPKDDGALIRVDCRDVFDPVTGALIAPAGNIGLYLNPASQFVGPPYRGATIWIEREDYTPWNTRLFAYANESVNGQPYIDIPSPITRCMLYTDGQMWRVA